jgi:CRP-like cAMP-binding protein
VAADAAKALIQVIRKIPIFDGLGPNQVRLLLTACRSGLLAQGQALCRSNTVSDEMYILLTGELGVSTVEGLRVATIRPVTTVGEMGVITGQPRSATVAATQPSKVLALAKPDFERMLGEDKHLCSRIYRNLIRILADKLSGDNLRLSEYQIAKRQLTGAVTVLERRIRNGEQRLQAVLDYVVGKELMHRAEAEQQIEARVAAGAQS